MEQNDVITFIRRIIWLLVIICVPFEIVFFPSWGNVVGCIMTLVSAIVYNTFFFKRSIVINHLFSYLMYTAMFLYRFLPLPVTLIELKPISYGMADPIRTFTLEILLFLISSVAYYLVLHIKKRKDGILNRIRHSLGLYQTISRKRIWLMGILGMVVRFVAFIGGIKSISAVGSMFMFAPVVLFFPNLYNKKSEKQFDLAQMNVWVYLAISVVLNFGANTRTEIVTPFAMMVLFAFVSCVVNQTNVARVFSPKNVIITILLVGVLGGGIGTVSKAMLINRSIRSEYTFGELIGETVNVITSGKLDELWNAYSSKAERKYLDYSRGWTEDYVDNFILNRFCNVRISDETLYLEKFLSDEGHKNMWNDFWKRILYIYPQPLINAFGIDFDKSTMSGSRGDMLYYYSGIGSIYNIGSLRVTSHIGDGLATFGFVYYPIQFMMTVVVFLLLESFVTVDQNSGVKYSFLGLMQIFSCLVMFRNATGIYADFSYCLRGYWQDLLLFWMICQITKILAAKNVI